MTKRALESMRKLSLFIVRKHTDPESLLIFGSSRSLHGLNKCHCLSLNIAAFRLHRRLPEFEPKSNPQT